MTPTLLAPYPLSLQLRHERYNGHLFLAPGRLYFVCTAHGSKWMEAIGHGVGGLIGGAIAAAGAIPTGPAPLVVDEWALAAAVVEHPGSLVMEATDVGPIKDTMWRRYLSWKGHKFGLPNGFGHDLSFALNQWAHEHGVATKGLR